MIKHLKKSKLVMVIACIAMIFCVSAGVSAVLYPSGNGNSATYDVGSEFNYITTEAVTVTLNIQSKKVGDNYLNDSYSVTLPAVSEGKAYTVRDVINSWMVQHGIILTSTSWDSTLYQFVEQSYDAANSTYIYSITKDGVKYCPDSINNFDTWRFRVNTRIPQLSAGMEADMSATYVCDGDVVTYYYDSPVSDADAARFTRIYEVTNDTDSIQVTVQQSYDWFMTVSPWTTYMYDFAAADDIPVVVKNATGTVVGNGTTDSNGIADITITDGVIDGVYTVEVAPAWKTSGLLEHTGDSIAYAVLP